MFGSLNIVGSFAGIIFHQLQSNVRTTRKIAMDNVKVHSFKVLFQESIANIWPEILSGRKCGNLMLCEYFM